MYIFGVILVCIHSECGEIRTIITPNTDTFRAVFRFSLNKFQQKQWLLPEGKSASNSRNGTFPQKKNYCLLYMTENCKESLDQVGYYGALLNDLSKVFDYTMLDLLIATLQPNGLNNNSVNFIFNYLLSCEQRIKKTSFFSTWSKIEYVVPQGIHTGTFNFQYKYIRHVP